MSNSITLKQLGRRSGSAKQVFEASWKSQGWPAGYTDGGTEVTPSRQRLVQVDRDGNLTEKSRQKIKDSDGFELDDFKGKTVKHIQKVQDGDMDTKAMDSGATQNFTPLVFDPEIVSIQKQEAPLVDLLPEEGQEGFKAVYNVISDRDAPIGYISESDAVDLKNNTESDITFSKSEVDMTIFADRLAISDFSQEAAAHYMNLEDTTLGERVAEHAQRKEQQILYGDPTQDTQTGFLGDAEGFQGLSQFASDAGNDVSKTGVSSGFIDDIKSEVRSLQADENVNINNLVIVTSPEFFDILETNADFDNLTTDPDTATVNVGLQNLNIAGVPVLMTHNIQSYTDSGNGTTYSPGSKSDVFIMSTRTARFRSLMPMSMVPLSKAGLSEDMALAEIGALIEKSEGNFIRYLENYDAGI